MPFDQAINHFCRVHELIYIEQGVDRGRDVYWFMDFGGTRHRFTSEELYRTAD